MIGLAHYLEHMLFLGTKSTRGWEYQQFVSNRGGYTNAYTAEINKRHFEIDPDHLMGR